MTNKSYSLEKVIAALSLCAFMYACGSAPVEVKKPISSNVNPQIGGDKTTAVSTAVEPAANADGKDEAVAAPAKDKKALVETGKKLIAGSDCLACHQEKTKLVGPSYQEVAQKYKEADVAKLAKKVIDGGSGVWGPIPMPPHVGLSQKDAESMIHYILTIK